MVKLIKLFFLTALIFFLSKSHAQNDTIVNSKSVFFKDVKFGGGLGLAIGNGYTDIYLAPTAYKPMNKFTTLGVGLIGSYVKSKNFYSSIMYGVSVIGLVNPIEEVQLSAEVEQLRVNLDYGATITTKTEENFWNTALFLGAGYHANNVTIGVRYNILYKERNNVYSQAWMPFVRVMF